jgi:hypothetical protein
MADGTALNVTLQADFKKLEADLKKAGLIAEKSVADIEDKFAKANPRLSADVFKGSFAGTLAAGAIKGIIEQIASIPNLVLEANKAIGEIGKSSGRTGLSTDRIQEIQFAAGKGGIGASDTLTALDSVARKIDEINHGSENGLSKLFADNKMKVQDLNSVLGNTAILMKGASNAFEKEKIAAAVGLSKEWVPVLENGATAFNKIGAEAYDAGSIIDKDVIQRAKDFERDWNTAVANFATNARANLGPFLLMLQDAVGLAAKVVSALGDKARGFAVDELTKNGPPIDPAQGPSVENYDYYFKKIRDGGDQVAEAWVKARDARAKYEEEAKKAQGAATLDVKGANGTTNVTSLYGKPGGGGAGEQADAVDRYLERLQKSVEVLAAEQAALGKTRAERSLGVEMAKAESAARQRGNELTSEEIAQVQALAARKGELNKALDEYAQKQHQVADLAQFTGQQIQGAFESLLDGGKIEDSINRITKALASAAIQAALLGQGPLAGLLGTGATPGGNGVGGLIGSLINGARASGGPVQSGKTYLVGENGPEMVRFGKNGTVQPNAVLGGGGGNAQAPVINIQNHTGAPVETRQSGSGGTSITTLIIGEVNKDIAKNGPLAQMLQNRYGMKRTNGRG